MALTADAQRFAAGMVAALPGLSPAVLSAWIACESASGSQLAAPYNFLNLGNPSWSFTSVEDAIQRTSSEIAGGPNWGGLRQSYAERDAGQQVVAIVDSPWAAGHYGAPATSGADRFGYPARHTSESCVSKVWSGGSAAGGVEEGFGPGPVGSVLNAGGAAADALGGAASGALTGIDAIGHFFALLAQGATWRRVGLLAGGVALVLVAFYLTGHDLFTGAHA